jgi:von Willebrand factor type A domain
MGSMRTRFGLGFCVALAGLTAGLGLVSACGDGLPESQVSTGASNSGGAANNGGSKNGNAGTLNLGGNGVGNSASGGSDGNSGSGGGENCAAVSQQAELSPVYLVFLLDESGSMGDGEHGDRTKKWDPVTSALNAFFADPESAGITASLSLFPLNKNTGTGAANQNQPADCQAAKYATPEVTPRALPDATAFSAAIAKLDPPNEYGTPTYPALSGTIAYAESLLEEDPARKVAIVMVTDGDPVSCQGNTIDNTAKAAAAVADRIPTYVIGVGDSLTSLDAIAAGGGTDKAFIVKVDDPNKKPEDTRKELLAAVNLIRGKSIACDLELPAPPAGKKMDPEKVNVQFTPDGQAAAPLKYGTACTGDTAWHFDDEQKPTKVLLCDDACTNIKADPKGKLDVVFECIDRQVVQ